MEADGLYGIYEKMQKGNPSVKIDGGGGKDTLSKPVCPMRMEIDTQ